MRSRLAPSSARALASFHHAWAEHVSLGFVVSQGEVARVARAFKVEPPILTGHAIAAARLALFHRLWASHVAAGLPATQHQADWLGEQLGVQAPSADPRGADRLHAPDSRRILVPTAPRNVHATGAGGARA